MESKNTNCPRESYSYTIKIEYGYLEKSDVSKSPLGHVPIEVSLQAIVGNNVAQYKLDKPVKVHVCLAVIWLMLLNFLINSCLNRDYQEHQSEQSLYN